jgi:hypothetical protein
MGKTYFEETVELIAKRKTEIADKWETECLRLLASGAVDRQNHSRGDLFGVALENISERYVLRTKEYKNLRKF